MKTPYRRPMPLGQIPGEAPKVIAEDFFTYSINITSIAAGATSTGFIQIEAEADFLVQKLTYFADIAGAAQTLTGLVVPLVSVVILDTGSGRQLMNEAVPIPTLFGDGRLPYILPTPKLFSKNSRINTTFANFSAGTAYRLWLNFEGKKIFTGN
jgi:hypothetical protein